MACMRSMGRVVRRTYIAQDLVDPESKAYTQEERKERKDTKLHRIKLMTDLFRKKLDIENFEVNLLDKTKIVIEPLRLRHELDTISYLRARNEVCCVIKPRKDKEAIYFIIHNTQARQLSRQTHIHNRPVYIQFEDELIRCTVGDIRKAVNGGWYEKIHFNRYQVGEPNVIKLALNIQDHIHEKMDKKKIEWNMDSVLVLCKNDIYPPSINIDFNRIIRKGAYTFGDLINQLPEGIELHPKFTRNLSFPICQLEDMFSKKQLDIMYVISKNDYIMEQLEIKFKPKAEEQENQMELNKEIIDEDDIVPKEPKKVKVRKNRSIKKALKGEQDKLRSEIERMSAELDAQIAEEEAKKK